MQQSILNGRWRLKYGDDTLRCSSTRFVALNEVPARTLSWGVCTDYFANFAVFRLAVGGGGDRLARVLWEV